MPQNWKIYDIGELVELKQGLAINKKTSHLLCDNGKGAIPLFKIRDLLKNTVEHYVKADEVPKQCIAKKEDLIYSRTGQVGYIFKGKEGCVHNNCFKVIPDERLDKGFLYQFLSNPVIRQFANDIASGSVQKDLNHTAFKSIPIKVPNSIQEQRAIASILSALDDKIELNLQMNKTLEEMAMALYKHWFVDFGPFKEGEFVDSELGKIPKGWEVMRLDSICEKIYSGGTPKTKVPEFWNGTIPWFSSGETREKYIIRTDKFITELGLEKSSCRMAYENDIVIASAGQGKTRGQTSLLMLDTSINQSVICLRADKKKIHPFTLFCDLSSRYNEFRHISDGFSTRGSLTTKLIGEQIKLILPNLDKLVRFINYQKSILIENQTLTKLRDTLLPKLISGEVRVKEALKQVNQVL
jgi:type I restriction enzyme S subunit